MKITPEFFTSSGKRCVRFLVDGKYLQRFNDHGKGPLEYAINDENGHEYYHVPNIYTVGEIGTINTYHFTRLPKDMLTTIREGDGDCIVRGMFGTEHVYRYLDRDYGEAFRQRTLEGWKDAKFGWGLYFENVVLSNKLEADSSGKPFVCASREEAEEMREYLVNRCRDVLILDYDRWSLKTKHLPFGEKDKVRSLWIDYAEDSRLNSHVLFDMLTTYASPFDYPDPNERKKHNRFNNGKCLKVCQVLLK